MNVLANDDYMHLAYFVKGYQTFNLKKSRFFHACRSFNDLYIRFSLSENGEMIPHYLLTDHKRPL